MRPLYPKTPLVDCPWSTRVIINRPVRYTYLLASYSKMIVQPFNDSERLLYVKLREEGIEHRRAIGRVLSCRPKQPKPAAPDLNTLNNYESA